jgi:hypothetical protein
VIFRQVRHCRRPSRRHAPFIREILAEPPTKPPTGLTEWDEAFLKGLYHSDHLDQQQILAVKTSMVQDIASKH